MNRWRHTLVAVAAGLIAGIGVGILTPPEVEDTPTGLAEVPPATPFVDEVVQALGDEPLYVDPDLAHIVDDDGRQRLLESIAEAPVPTYVTVARTGGNDGFNGFPGILNVRIAAERDQDGLYILVDQDRDADAFFWTAADADADALPAFLDEGSWDAALGSLVEEMNQDHLDAVERTEGDDPPAPVWRAVLGAALGAAAGASLYLLSLLVIGWIRVARGVSFAPPKAGPGDSNPVVEAARRMPTDHAMPKRRGKRHQR